MVYKLCCFWSVLSSVEYGIQVRCCSVFLSCLFPLIPPHPQFSSEQVTVLVAGRLLLLFCLQWLLAGLFLFCTYGVDWSDLLQLPFIFVFIPSDCEVDQSVVEVKNNSHQQIK